MAAKARARIGLHSRRLRLLLTRTAHCFSIGYGERERVGCCRLNGGQGCTDVKISAGNRPTGTLGKKRGQDELK